MQDSSPRIQNKSSISILVTIVFEVGRLSTDFDVDCQKLTYFRLRSQGFTDFYRKVALDYDL